jgi:hypothetical protein
MNILVAKHIFGENYRQCKSKFPEDILFIIAEYAIDEIGMGIIRMNATMPNLQKYYLSTENFMFYLQCKPYDSASVYNIRVRDTELLKSICDVIQFAYEKKPSTSKCKLEFHEKHEIERNVAGEFPFNYCSGLNYVSKFKRSGYVSYQLLMTAFIIAGYEYKFTQSSEPFQICGKRRNIGNAKAFIKREKELHMPPSYLKIGYGRFLHKSDVGKQILDYMNIYGYGTDPMLHRAGSYKRAGALRCKKLIEFYNLHYDKKDWKQAASLEACGSTMLSINPENLKPLAGGGCGLDIRNFFGAKK